MFNGQPKTAQQLAETGLLSAVVTDGLLEAATAEAERLAALAVAGGLGHEAHDLGVGRVALDVGHECGDLLAVEHNTPTKPGDIVLACVDNELTVKTLRLDTQGRWYLEPANPAYECIKPSSSLEVLGVVVGLVRRLRH